MAKSLSSPTKIIQSLVDKAKLMSPDSSYGFFTGAGSQKSSQKMPKSLGEPASNMQQQLDKAQAIIEHRGALIQKLNRQVRQADSPTYPHANDKTLIHLSHFYNVCQQKSYIVVKILFRL